MVHRGIRVNAIAPGPFWTALQISGGQTEDNIHNFGAETPMGRAGQPVELAPVYVLLASSEASYITGQVYAPPAGRAWGNRRHSGRAAIMLAALGVSVAHGVNALDPVLPADGAWRRGMLLRLRHDYGCRTLHIGLAPLVTRAAVAMRRVS